MTSENDKHPQQGGALCASDVAFSYGRAHRVLQRISADIVRGSFLAIIGVNGCGKSTFLDCLDGILKPQRGTVRLGGRDLDAVSRRDRAQSIAYVAQHSHANRLIAYDALLLGRKPFIEGTPSDEDFAIVDGVIADMGLHDLAFRYMDELSGGEYQKIVIGRALVQCRDVLLLDEPTNNLDLANQLETMSLIRRTVDTRGIAAAAVLHDINLALAFCDRFLALKQGEPVAYGGPEAITESLIRLVYGIDADIIEHNGKRIVIPH